MPSPEYLSPEQFSERTGLSIATVRRYLRAGKLTHVQPAGFRGRVLIPVDALTHLTVQPGAEPSSPATAPSGGGRQADAPPSQRPGPIPAWRRGRPV
jgi:excisionase family DNA binding protein